VQWKTKKKSIDIVFRMTTRRVSVPKIPLDLGTAPFASGEVAATKLLNGLLLDAGAPAALFLAFFA